MSFNKSSKILIAGYRGMVGSAIYRNLEDKGFNNIITADIGDVDFTRQEQTEAFFERHRPEYVFLAAAKVGGIIANDTYKADFIYINIMIAANVINAAKKSGVKKLLNLGSSCIYPKHSPQPMKEEHLLTGLLEPTNEPYAIAKISAIKLCEYFNYQYDTNFISLMPTNLYGPNDNFNLETSHVLPALVRKFVLGKALMEGDMEFLKADIKKRPLGFGYDEKIKTDDDIISALSEIGISASSVKLWGTGKVKREFLYVEDLAEACTFFMQNVDSKDMPSHVNIGTGEDLEIKELAELVAKTVGYSGKIDWDSTKPDGTPRKLLDVSLAKSLGWKPEISLEEGVSTIVKNYYDG